MTRTGLQYGINLECEVLTFGIWNEECGGKGINGGCDLKSTDKAVLLIRSAFGMREAQC